MPAPLLAVAAVGVLGVVGVATVGVVVANVNSSDAAVVTRVIDGDTIDVTLDGDTERVRLLNVDAPEDNQATGESECLGPEATAALTAMLPAGTEVSLRYDSERRDRYDRLLAGVFVDDTFVNAELAREGLAGSLLIGDNDRFLTEVQEAEQDAVESKRGIFSDEISCTLGSSLSTYEAQVSDAVSGTLPKDSASISKTLATVTAVVLAADVAEDAIDAITWVPQSLRKTFLAAVSSAKSTAVAHESKTDAALETAKEREAEEARIAAEKAAAEKAAAEKAAAEKAAAEKAAAEAAQRAAQAQREAGTSSGSPGGTSGGGYDGYTGCRAYGSGGTSIDEKGRPYTKIDCTTKLPLP